MRFWEGSSDAQQMGVFVEIIMVGSLILASELLGRLWQIVVTVFTVSEGFLRNVSEELSMGTGY